MKITRKKLKEMIREELQEISGTRGGSKRIKSLNTKQAVADKRKTKAATYTKSASTEKATYDRAAAKTADQVSSVEKHTATKPTYQKITGWGEPVKVKDPKTGKTILRKGDPIYSAAPSIYWSQTTNPKTKVTTKTYYDSVPKFKPLGWQGANTEYSNWVKQGQDMENLLDRLKAREKIERGDWEDAERQRQQAQDEFDASQQELETDTAAADYGFSGGGGAPAAATGTGTGQAKKSGKKKKKRS